MNGWTRFGGYLGLTVLLGSIALLAIVPKQRLASSSVRDAAGFAAVAAYLLVIGRLGYLAANADRRDTRVFARLAMLMMFIVGVGFFAIAPSLVTMQANPAA